MLARDDAAGEVDMLVHGISAPIRGISGPTGPLVGPLGLATWFVTASRHELVHGLVAGWRGEP